MEQQQQASRSELTSEEKLFIGQVKWFNVNTGYGFISVDGTTDLHYEMAKDVFVHHSAIKVASEQYRYLIQGEYVQFTLYKMPEGSNHEFTAGKVTGINGGKLMCELRNDSRNLHPKTKYNEKKTVAQSSNRQQKTTATTATATTATTTNKPLQDRQLNRRQKEPKTRQVVDEGFTVVSKKRTTQS